MNRQLLKRQVVRKRRVMRVRKKLRGTAIKPRMSVVKSNLHVSVQLIDDEAGKTLASIGTNSKEFKGTEFNRKNKLAAEKVGARIAEMAIEQNIKEVVFDRGRAKYHGVLAAVADAAREKGLNF
ncbi:MAG: 50S ribosomal protein L18 [Chlamydiia bacterium]|nr:50S ribosomal protein L18 [Chlamydiia bacterium]